MGSIKPYLQLMRPANIVTAVSDILAGVAIALLFVPVSVTVDWPALLALMVSTIGLYGGGVVFNDVFDASLDASERPERPLPSGRASMRGAVGLGSALFLLGVVAAWWVDLSAVLIATAIVLMCLIYDRWAKHHSVTGPLAMGLCRGLNLLLGMSYSLMALDQVWFLAGVPVIYIAAVTTISRGEVHGGQRMPLLFSATLYAIVVGCVAAFGLYYHGGVWGAGMLLPFVCFVFPPLVKAMQTLKSGDIRKSVKHGVIGLIFLNAAWAAAAGMWPLAFATLLLFPLSSWMAKLFAVT